MTHYFGVLDSTQLINKQNLTEVEQTEIFQLAEKNDPL